MTTPNPINTRTVINTKLDLASKEVSDTLALLDDVLSRLVGHPVRVLTMIRDRDDQSMSFNFASPRIANRIGKNRLLQKEEKTIGVLDIASEGPVALDLIRKD